MNPSSSTIDVQVPSSGYIARTRKQLLQLALGRTSLTLIDQAVVSAVNFLTSILIGRYAGQDALGVYALVFSISMLLLSVSESLVSLPYTIQYRQVSKSARRSYLGSTLIQTTVIAMIATPLLVFAGMAYSWMPTATPSMSTALIVLGVAAPVVMLRDYGRRITLAHLRPDISIAIDTTASLMQIAGLIALVLIGWLTAQTAWLGIAIASAIASLGWLWMSRGEFEIRSRRLRYDVIRNWRLGKWVFASQLCYVVNTYCLHWLIASKLSVEATGAFVGCITVVLLCNPFILGMHNLLSPRIADAIANDGKQGFRRVITETTFILAAFMSLFCGLIAIFGEQLTVLIFDDSYAGEYDTMLLFAIAMLVVAIGMPADHALWVKHRPLASFLAGLLATVVTFVTALACLPSMGITGAAFGLLAGNCCGTLWRWWALVRLEAVQESSN